MRPSKALLLVVIEIATLNLRNHSRHVLSAKALSPYAEHINSLASVAVLSRLNWNNMVSNVHFIGCQLQVNEKHVSVSDCGLSYIKLNAELPTFQAQKISSKRIHWKRI